YKIKNTFIPAVHENTSVDFEKRRGNLRIRHASVARRVRRCEVVALQEIKQLSKSVDCGTIYVEVYSFFVGGMKDIRYFIDMWIATCLELDNPYSGALYKT